MLTPSEQIGFTFFFESNTAQGLQNEMCGSSDPRPRRAPLTHLGRRFSIFLLVMTFGPLCQQLMPLFCTQRALYEARTHPSSSCERGHTLTRTHRAGERPSKTYSWQAFLMAQILVELPSQTLVSVLTVRLPPGSLQCARPGSDSD